MHVAAETWGFFLYHNRLLRNLVKYNAACCVPNIFVCIFGHDWWREPTSRARVSGGEETGLKTVQGRIQEFSLEGVHH